MKYLMIMIVSSVMVTRAEAARVMSATPKQDLAELVARAQPGTHIILGPGVYDLVAKPPYQQCILIENKKGLKISARFPERTTIRLPSDAKFGFYIGSNIAQLYISDLKIEGTLPLKVNTHAIGSYSSTTNVRGVSITGVTIQKVAVGISISTSDKGKYENVQVTGNTLRDLVGVDPGWGYGIHCENAKHTTISENVIDNAGRHSIYLARAGKGANITVRGNLIINHNSEGKQPRWYAAALVCSRSSDVRIMGNVILKPQSVGISVERDEIRGQATEKISLINNHIIGAPYVGIWLTTGQTHIGLGNRIQLDQNPPNRDWCKAISAFDYATGKPTESKLSEPNARWREPKFIAGTDGRLFVLSKEGELDDVLIASWKRKTCPKRFKDASALAVYKPTPRRGSERVMVATETGLTIMSPSTWRVVRSYPQWSGAKWVVVDEGKIFLMKNDVIHQLDARSFKSLKALAGWKDIQWMGVLAGRLCVIQDGKYHWIDWNK